MSDIHQLREEIRAHNRRYFVDAQPTISDLEYDRLMQRLQQLEAANPELVSQDSPTQRVGEAPVSHLVQVSHRAPMLSIENTYSKEELLKFSQRVAKLLPDESIEWVVELKIDGVAASLIYRDGLLEQALTRGDGRVGDDITHNIRTLRDVPLRLTENVPGVLEVRGEVYMTNSDLVRLNQQQTEKGLAPYANTRNVTAGSIRLLDSQIAAQRPLRFFAHSVGLSDTPLAPTHTLFLERIRQLGIPTTPWVRTLPNVQAAIDYCDEVIDQLHELDFEVDGIVLKVDNLAQREQLGSTSKSPRWVAAYKFEKYEATTRLNAIRVQIGKTGTITPVANLEPVELAGTIVSRASLHNADELQRKDIREGDIVVVEKAGKIIPHVVRVEKHLRKGNEQPYSFPTQCPECDTPLAKDEGGVYIRCPNLDCPAQVKERVKFFCSRNAMDIEGMGEKLVDQLVSAGYVRSFGDLYRLESAELQKLERMGVKSADNLVMAVDASKTRGLARLLNALSIRHVGRTVSEKLATSFRSMDKLQEASLDDLGAVDEIGQIIAQSVFDFLHSPNGAEIIADLCRAGVVMETDQPIAANDTLIGKTFVVTGTLTKYTRDEIHDLIRQHGGKPSTSVSKKTDFLIAGDNAGSKLEKATSLGVAVLSEDEFAAMLL